MEIRLKNNGSAAMELVGCQVNYAPAEFHPIMQLPQPSPVPVTAAVGDFLAPFVVEPSLQHAAEQVNQQDGSDITLFVGFPVRPLVLAKLPDPFQQRLGDGFVFQRCASVICTAGAALLMAAPLEV
jgi:hypothetical protein